MSVVADTDADERSALRLSLGVGAFCHIRDDFLERFHPGDFFHPKPLKIGR